MKVFQRKKQLEESVNCKFCIRKNKEALKIHAKKMKGFKQAGSPPCRVSLCGAGAGRGLSVCDGGLRGAAAGADGGALHVAVSQPRPRCGLGARRHRGHAGSVSPRPGSILGRSLRGVICHAVISGPGGGG